MPRAILFILFGYLSGSVLYARVAAQLFHKESIFQDSPDENPGTSNAFVYGGFRCGLLTLVGDVTKGFLPVYCFLHSFVPETSVVPMALVMAAPVIGHAFPVFYRFRGGKGIAVSFGCLLGLLPVWKPLAILALFFLFFSIILQITPHFYRTFVTYLCSAVTVALLVRIPGITVGFLLISGIVCLRLHISKETREAMKVRLL